MAQLPPLYCAHGTRVAYLTALREVAVADVTDARYRCSFDADGEPSLLALCETGLAMAWASKVGLISGCSTQSSQCQCKLYQATSQTVATRICTGARAHASWAAWLESSCINMAKVWVHGGVL